MQDKKDSTIISKIPSIDKLLKTEPFRILQRDYGRSLTKKILQNHLAVVREKARHKELESESLEITYLVKNVQKNIQCKIQSKLQSVFNLTGIVLHTNLGRSLLPNEAINAIVRTSAIPVNLELDLENNKRIDRELLIEDQLCQLTGGDAATIVNNNASAILIMLKTLANRKEVIISRGELVEIGGTFRLTDIMKSSGVKLCEIGTTNCTNECDYRNSINKKTAVLMKVNCSNYKISGFTKSVELKNIANIGREFGIPVCVDLGSGSLLDFSEYELPKEDTVKEAIFSGADLVTFSGDKMLGGPQAGLLVGQSDLIMKIRKNPLMRALRVSKLTLTALEAILNLYQSPELLSHKLPTLRLLIRSQVAIRSVSEKVKPIVQKFLGSDYEVESVPMNSAIGGGSCPTAQLSSYGLLIKSNKKGYLSRSSIMKLESRLKGLPRPVLGRLSKNSIWLDFRCLEEFETKDFIKQLSI